MSRDASITFDWGDGTHTFRLGIGQLRELQEKCGDARLGDAGPALILRRLSDGTWLVDDLIQTHRLGLMGGDKTMKSEDAVKLTRRYVEERPLLESVLSAQAILHAALVGAPDEPLGKAEAATDPANLPSPEEKSDSPPSTPAEQ